MDPLLEPIAQDLANLEAKRAELQGYMTTEAFDALDEVVRNRLSRMEMAMQQYAGVLKEWLEGGA